MENKTSIPLSAIIIKMDCNDFNVNPFITIMDVFNEIINDDDLENYISLDEYQYIIYKLALLIYFFA